MNDSCYTHHALAKPLFVEQSSWNKSNEDTMQHTVLQCVAVCCSVLECGGVCCSVLQCVAVCCSVSLRKTLYTPWKTLYNTVCCSVLQCVAVCCSVLQCKSKEDTVHTMEDAIHHMVWPLFICAP